METLTMNTEKLTSFNNSNIEAVMKSGRIWAAGVQDLSKTVAAATQAQFDHAMSAWKALGSVRSPREAIELQTSLARTSFETALAQTGAIADASAKLAEQTMAPITAHMKIAIEMFTHPKV
jgi:phasin family protein